MKHRTRGGVAAMLASVVAMIAASAFAQTPQRTTATYGDWTVRCEMSGEPAVPACEIFQAISVQGQTSPVAQVALAPREEGGFRLVVQAPLNVWLPADVKFSAGEDAVVTAEYKRCFPQFCLAEADLPDVMMEDLRGRGGEGRVSFQDGAQREVTVPLSFNGLADAYAALIAETAKSAEGGGAE